MRPWSNPLLSQDAGLVAGVNPLLVVKLPPVSVIEVQQGLVYSALLTFQYDDFVDFAPQIVAGGEPPQKAQLIVR